MPAPSSAAESATGMTGSSNAAGGGEIYIVKSGDSLSRIARHYGTTVKAIESENNLVTTRIKVGQKLKIPSRAEAPAPAAAPAPAPGFAPAPASADTGAAAAPDNSAGNQP